MNTIVNPDGEEIPCPHDELIRTLVTDDCGGPSYTVFHCLHCGAELVPVSELAARRPVVEYPQYAELEF